MDASVAVGVVAAAGPLGRPAAGRAVRGILTAVRVTRAPHRWAVSPAAAAAIQRRLAPLVRRRGPLGTVRYVAGLDSGLSRDGTRCVGAVVLWDLRADTVIERRVTARRLTFPYVPGLLSFREAPVLLAGLRRLGHRPDVIMCDGHGLAHPRRFGLACHIGLLAGVPTIGCAKSRLIGHHREPGRRRGLRTALREGAERLGTVLRTQDGVRPVFVSIGHRITLSAAERVVLGCAVHYRLPEPTRLADHLVTQAIRAPSSLPPAIQGARSAM